MLLTVRRRHKAKKLSGWVGLGQVKKCPRGAHFSLITDLRQMHKLIKSVPEKIMRVRMKELGPKRPYWLFQTCERPKKQGLFLSKNCK